MSEQVNFDLAVTFNVWPTIQTMIMIQSVEASLRPTRVDLESDHRARREQAAQKIEKIAKGSPDSLACRMLRNRVKMLRMDDTWRGAVEDLMGAAMAYQVRDGDPARDAYQEAWRAVAALAVEA